MPAHSDEFPWPSPYGNYQFFEQRMRSHGKVAKFSSDALGCYLLTLAGTAQMVVFVCDCYSFGLAEYFEVRSKIDELDAIIVNSNWCGYTTEAKNAAIGDRVGIFNIADFMGALNRSDFWNYTSPETA